MSETFFSVNQIITEMLPQFFVLVFVLALLVGIPTRFLKNL